MHSSDKVNILLGLEQYHDQVRDLMLVNEGDWVLPTGSLKFKQTRSTVSLLEHHVQPLGN